MSAKYIMQEMVDFRHEGETLLYPRLLISGSCSTDQLASAAASGTTFSPGELKAAIGLLARGMATIMAAGRSVRLEGIGLFTPSLALKQGREREQPGGKGSRRNAASIRVGGVNFRPNKELLHELDRLCVLERTTGIGARRQSAYTPEERLALAQDYLEKHPIMHVSDYASLTGLSRTTAGRELRRWQDTPGSGIGTAGSGPHKVYVREKEQEQA